MSSWRLESRGRVSSFFNASMTASSLGVALILGGVLMFLLGVNPLAAYYEIVRGALGSAYGFSETLVKAIPLTLTGLACLMAFRMLIWNIGAEGQLVMGALATAAVVRYFPMESGTATFVAVFLAASAAGGIWGAIPGFLKGKWNVNEIIATLMLNYIALCILDLLLYGGWRDPTSLGFPMTPQFPEQAMLWSFAGTRVHGGVILAAVAPLLAWIVLRKMQWGFEIRVIGENRTAARYAGMGIMKNILLVMFVSGAIAGIAGMGEVAGLQGRLSRGFSVGYGFTGVIVAWLSRLNPLALPFVAFLMGMLLVGGDTLQVVMNLPLASVQVIQGMILFCVLGGEVLCRYKIRRVSGVAAKGVR